MCLAADIPHIESGTAGYLGQVAVIKKFFNDDIKYLLTMDKLWKKRKAPVPLDRNEVQKLAMAWNIIPAIATTNAVIAGLILLEGLKILSGYIEQCKTIFLNKQPNPRKKLLVPCALDPPNANCYVCASQPEVTVKLNVHQTSAELAGQGNNYKCLSEFGIRHGSRLQADDFLQDYTLLVNVLHCEDLGKDVEFEVVGDTPEKPIEKTTEEPAKSIANGSDDGAQPSTSKGDCRLFHLTDD
ncbi:UNVERIFIED_CONTAM: hypothetical protein FKN15_023422 [Acipenser sinensis]